MKIAAKDIPWYVADFETTGINEYERTGATRVWLWSIADANGNISADGSSIDSFMEWLMEHPSSLVYFHNLKFDGTFILNWLFANNFNQEQKLLTHSKRGFATLIGDLGEFYQIKINFAPNKQVTIQDSLKIIPLKVKEIAKAFNLPIQKEIIDYDDYTIDDKRLEYVHHDVQIVAMAMKFFRDKGFTRMTIGSNAYHEFMGNSKTLRRLFPRLGTDFLEEWRSAYRGGRSQVNPIHAGKILTGVRRYDINSMYPYVMAECWMPYGWPIEIQSRGRFEFEIYDIDIDFDLKEGHLPTLLKKGGIFSKGDSYYIDTDGIENIKITSVDLEILERHYNINYIKFNKMYGFKTTKIIFRDFIHKYYELKSNSTGGLRLVYKLILNNLYGKYGSKPKGRNKIPYIAEDGSLAYNYSEEHEMQQYYLPVAMAVTSWAHLLIDNAIMTTGFENFVYCDTDSIHTLGTLPDSMVDHKELGKFKLEATESLSKYVRQKCYITKDSSGWNITCCGMPDSIKNFLISQYGDTLPDHFHVGLSVDLSTPNITRSDVKLAPKQVPGGTILMPTKFSLL